MGRTLYISFFLLLVAFSGFSQSPENYKTRSNLLPQFAPFYHGVASGDPLTDRVIIWTRVTPDSTLPVTVNWRMALDTAMTNIIQSGTASTDASRDYCLKVDVTGLQPYTYYYYDFEMNGRYSLVGRTKTAPAAFEDSLRFAIVSCSNYPSGFFNAYQSIAKRNDIDAVIHLGDYIYENESSGSVGRPHDPPKEILDLADYRMRYSQYRLDNDLRCLHQMYPMISVWDDHETANDSWNGGAENHQSGEGPWALRKAAGTQAYQEWMPIRQPDTTNNEKIYRKIRYGNLVDLIMLDTRLIGRDEQDPGAAGDTSRNMLGQVQLNWLANELMDSTTQWKIIGQQVMMAPLELPFVGPVNYDQWDGYAAERDRFYDIVLSNSLKNIVVLTGDIHTAWANNLPGPNYVNSTGAGSVGVEFVTTSVTSGNSVVSVPVSVIQFENEHVRYSNLSDHGFTILDINKTRTQADFMKVADIENPDKPNATLDEAWLTNDKDGFLTQASGMTTGKASLSAPVPPKTPANPPVSRVGGIENPRDFTLIGTYPNPFGTEFMVKFYSWNDEKVHLEIFDSFGKRVHKTNIRTTGKGLYIEKVAPGDLPQGLYHLILTSGDQQLSAKIYRY